MAGRHRRSLLPRTLLAALAVGVALATSTGPAYADVGAPGRRPALDPALLTLLDEYQAAPAPAALAAAAAAAAAEADGLGNPLLPIVGDSIVIDAVASGDPAALLADLTALGLQEGATAGAVVSGLLPIAAIADLAALHTLRFARPAYATTVAGFVASQGDVAMGSNVARGTFGVDGAGVTVGVLSDSFDCLGGAWDDAASGDLPPSVLILAEGACPAGKDEGRAMMQIVHDVAPGADLAFHRAFSGMADFAGGILALAALGADVIVDDVFYFAEPMFQDGIVAQAVDAVVGQGAAYFSAAGNAGRNAYEAEFRPGNTFADGARATDKGFDTRYGAYAPHFYGGTAHDFDPGPGVDVLQGVTVPPGTELRASFQWDQPFSSVSGGAGAANEVDIYVLNAAGTTVLGGGAATNLGGDAVEVFGFYNPSGSGQSLFNVMIVHDFTQGGPAPGLLKYVLLRFNGSVNEYATASGTVFGHANAAGAETVGAAAYGQTPAFGVTPALLEPFSSGGPTPILFDVSGSPAFEVRAKPDLVGPDGVNNTFFGSDTDGDGRPNFFGTSAAAPHVAGVAALMLEAAPALAPASLYAMLEATATDMGAADFDFDSGFGLVQAAPALALASAPPPVPTPTPTPTPVPAASVWALSALAAVLALLLATRPRRTPPEAG